VRQEYAEAVAADPEAYAEEDAGEAEEGSKGVGMGYGSRTGSRRPSMDM